MNIYISVVSHGHNDIIQNIACLTKLNKHKSINVIVLDNLRENSLLLYCKSNGITYLENQTCLGFGENNNKVFDYCERSFQLCDDDYFLVLNPDVDVTLETVLGLVNEAKIRKISFFTLNLFKDRSKETPDPCLRRFPQALDFVSSYIGFGNRTIIDKALIEHETEVEWGAGSFLVFSTNLYRQLGGFDTKYFMYCEDIDICWRAKNIIDTGLLFFPQFEAIHFAQHANRKLISKHFLWHVKSALRYLAMYYKIRKPYKNREV